MELEKDFTELETVEEVLALLETRPEDAELYQQLGVLHLRAKRFAESRQAFERSLELDPQDAFTHLHFSNCLQGLKLYAEALALCQRAVELLPDEAVGYWCQGNTYLYMGRYSLAQQAYETAVRIEPDDPTAREKLSKWYACRTGTTDETPRMLRRAYRDGQAATTVLLAARWLESNPNDLEAVDVYAETLYEMTRYDEAIQVYLNAIERFIDNRSDLYNRLGQLHQYRGDFPAAELWHQKAIAEKPDEAGSYIFLGAVQARQGKLPQAEETHRRATQCSEGCIDEAYHNVGLVLRGQGRLAEAAECFRKAIELCPDYEEAIEALYDVEAAMVLSLGSDSPGA